MSGSIFGKSFTVTTFGESHGTALGAVVDGCPAGIPLSEPFIQSFLDRRKPGQSFFSTKRKESDTVAVLSGVFEGKTTGTPIALLLNNENEHSADYTELADQYRPGHADYSFDKKYGFRDYRGGGRSSGRETAARVAAGAVASALLAELQITVCAYTRSVYTHTCPSENEYLYADFSGFDDLKKLRDQSPLLLPDETTSSIAENSLHELIGHRNSAGGTIECVIHGLPAGLGEPVFDKFDAKLAQAMLSIGAVKGFEIGAGFNSARTLGTEQNDSFLPGPDGRIVKKTNHAGGVLGGITDGDDVCFRVAIKPTPSVSCPQETVKTDGSACTIQIKGRHDPIIVPRAVVVVESMAAIVAADLLLQDAGSTLSKLKKIF